MTENAITETAASDQPSQHGPLRNAIVTSSFGALIGTAISLLLLVGYHTMFHQPPLRFATGDLTEVVEIKQLQVTAMASRVGATDADREAAWDSIGAFGRQVETVLAEMQSDCGCLILVRAAVVKGATEDLTPRLKAALGMEGLTVQSAAQQVIGQARSTADSRRQP